MFPKNPEISYPRYSSQTIGDCNFDHTLDYPSIYRSWNIFCKLFERKFESFFVSFLESIIDLNDRNKPDNTCLGIFPYFHLPCQWVF